MTILFFDADRETGLIRAGYVVGGAFYTSLVLEQAGQPYVTTGSRVKGDFQRHDFTRTQAAAYEAFLDGTAYRVEYGLK